MKIAEETTLPAAAPRRWRNVVVWTSVTVIFLVGLYAAVGFWWVPRLLAKQLPPLLAQRYGLQLTLGRVKFNPFRYSIDAKNIVLRTSDGKPLLRADKFAADYAPSGLLHRTWTFDHITLGGVQVDLVLAKDGKLNLLDVLHRVVPPSAAPSDPPPRIAVDQITVSEGSVLYSDLRGSAAATATISPVSFSMVGLSTVPGHKASQTLSATLPDGATVHMHGELVLQPALMAQGQLALENVQAKSWLPFVRNDLRIERLEGSAAFSANYRYATAQGLRLDDVVVQVSDLLLAASGVQAPLITMQKVDAAGGTLDLTRHSAVFARVTMAQGQASVAIAADGKVGWAELMPATSAAAPAAAASVADTPAWGFSVTALQLDRVGLAYDDRQRATPLRANVGSIDGALRLMVTTGSHADVKLENVAMSAHDMALPAADPGGPGVTIASLAVRDGSFELAAKRVAAQELSIKGGSVSAARDADGSIDWSRRLAPAQGVHRAPASADKGWQYDIAKARMEDVGIALTDRSLTPALRYDLRVASASAQHVANGSQQPVSFDATISANEGGMLHAKGSVATDGANLQASVQLQQLALSPFRGLIAHSTGFDVTGGPLTLTANLHNAKGFVVDGIDLDLPKLVVRLQAGADPLFTVARLQAHGGQVDLAQQQVVIGQLTLADGAGSARRQPDGRLDWQTAANRPGPTPSAGAVAASPWNVRIAALDLSNMAAHYTDLGQPTPWQLNIGRVDLGMALQLSAGGAATQLSAHDIRARVHSAALLVGDHQPPALALAAATLSGGTFDLAARRLAADTLALTGGGTQIVRDAQGHIVALDALISSAPAATPKPSAHAEKVSPWQYALGSLEVKNFAVQAQDQAFTPSLALDGHVDATVENLANNGLATFNTTLSLAKSGGTVNASGSAMPGTGSVQAQVIAKSLDLMPVQPLLSRYTTLALRSGTAESDLSMQYEPGASGALRASGQLHIGNLALDEGVRGAPFLTLDALDATQIDFSSSGPRLNVGEVALRNPVTRIAIANDHSVNLTAVVKHSGDKAAQEVATRPDASASAPRFALGVQHVRIRGGSVDYSDQSLVLPFSTKVTAINATIAGISNDDTRRADVQAKGSIQTYGSASVDGSILPFDPRRDTDLRVKFNNVMVQPFSPYTATFAGRAVQSGKVWLDLAYKIDNSELLGQNDVRLVNFVLGEPIKSPASSDLPLSLAVSLLTDANGEINLSVPVRGNLDNPHFDISATIAHAFANTLGRIVTAPFRLLGRLLGGKDGSLANSIDFAPGSATLAPDQREKLDALTQALQQRPLLQLVISAPYEADADTHALQQAAARHALAARLQQPLVNDNTSLVVAFDDPATRAALRAMRAEIGGQGAAAASVTAPGADNRAAYQAMFDQIARQQPVSASATRILATRRAERIAQFLTEKGIERARLLTGQVESVPVTDAGTVDARLAISGAQR